MANLDRFDSDIEIVIVGIFKRRVNGTERIDAWTFRCGHIAMQVNAKTNGVGLNGLDVLTVIFALIVSREWRSESRMCGGCCGKRFVGRFLDG